MRAHQAAVLQRYTVFTVPVESLHFEVHHAKYDTLPRTKTHNDAISDREKGQRLTFPMIYNCVQ